MTIDGAPAKDVTLTIDGQTIASAVIGLARPIDPGQHTVAAKSASAESETSTVMVPEGGAQSVTLVMHPVASSGSSPTTEAPVAQGQGEQPSGHTGLRVAGWIGVGVGVVGAALGTVFLMSNHSNLNDANALCGPTVCPASKRDQIDKLDSNAKSAATLSWVSYGVGVAGLGTGVVLLVMSGSKASSPAQTARVTPWVGPTSVGLTGTF